MPSRVRPVRRPAASAPGLVPRPRLVHSLIETRAPLVLLTAPAGYGKTVLLREWAAREDRVVVWGGGAGDPFALDEVGAHGPSVLVIDDADTVAVPALLRLTEALARQPEAGCTIALAARRRPPVPIGRLRAHRLAVEIDHRQLAMTRLEAAMLLDAAGLRLRGDQVDRLLERTEGWPAALYLAALAIVADGSADEAIARFGGDPLLGDYVRTEVLGCLSPRHAGFLRRTAILPRLGAPLCDAVLDTSDAAAILPEVAAATALVQPVDRAASEWRRHGLLTEVLATELGHAEPELVTALHERAARWHASRGAFAAALEHAVAGDDRAHAGRLLWAQALTRAARGDGAGSGAWLGRFGPSEVSGEPTLALTAAVHHVLEGRRDECERWVDAAAGGPGHAAGVALLRACSARSGVGAMADHAARAAELMSPGDPWQALASLLEAVACHLTGDREPARALLEDGARRAQGTLPIVEALAHAQLALLDLEAEDADAAARRAPAACACLDDVPASAPLRTLVHAVAAATAAHAGEVARARREAAAAQRLLPRLEGFTPWYVAESQIWLARAAIRLSDAAAARALLAAAARTQARVADAGVLSEWLHDAWERADAFAAGTAGGGPKLTIAELRVLRFLPSHLTFREIGARLHVSTNTVKTHAVSVYRKLDVSCRSDAVTQGRRIGLIDG